MGTSTNMLVARCDYSGKESNHAKESGQETEQEQPLQGTPELYQTRLGNPGNVMRRM